MTSVDSSTLGAAATAAPAAVIEPKRPPGPLLRAWRDCSGLVSLTLRLAWRHWPVLLSLGLAGTIGRELVLTAALKATDLGAIVGFLVFLLAPLALMIAMVLMLRSVRPSLPRIGPSAREPVFNHLGSVLIPFLVFYLYSGFLDYDYERFVYAIAYEEMISSFGQEPGESRYATASVGIAVVAAVALILRWLANRFGVIRRRPVLGVPAAYLEIVWIGTAFLLATEFLDQFTAWRDERVVWQAGLQIWRSDFAVLGSAAPPLREVRDFLTVIWAATEPVLVVPVAALLSGAVVLAVSTTALRSRRPSQSRLARILRVGGYAGRPYGRVAGLVRFVNTVRLVFRSGAVSMMAFCLLFLTVSTVDEWLNLPERALIGSQSVQRVWEPLYFPLQWFNQAVGLVLLMCLIAAAVELSPLAAASEESRASGRGQQDVPR